MTPHASEAEALFPKLADASVVIGGIFGENCNGKKCVDDARTLIVALLAEVEALRKRCEAADERYYDLIMQVERKFPNESRHETAKRYIYECENAGSREGAEQESTP